jgi:hypothetical protein
VFDRTDEKSFTDIKYWIREIDNGSEKNCIKIILCNKMDKL